MWLNRTGPEFDLFFCIIHRFELSKPRSRPNTAEPLIFITKPNIISNKHLPLYDDTIGPISIEVVLLILYLFKLDRLEEPRKNNS